MTRVAMKGRGELDGGGVFYKGLGSASAFQIFITTPADCGVVNKPEARRVHRGLPLSSSP